MVYEFVEAIAKRRSGEYAPDSLNWAQAAGTTVDFELTIPDKWVGYLMMVSGYTTGDLVKVTFIDHDGIPRWEWTELMDTMRDYKVLPVLEKWYRGTIKFRFVNNSSTTRTMSWCTEILLIPEAEREDFEKDVRALADLIPAMKTLVEVKDLLEELAPAVKTLAEIRDMLKIAPRRPF